MRVLSTIFFFVWVLSLTIYSEAYLFFAARSLPEVLSRLRDERKVVKCVLLFLLPSLCRLARILLIALVTK